MSDADIGAAVRHLHVEAGLRVEPSGAASVAALLAGRYAPGGPGRRHRVGRQRGRRRVRPIPRGMTAPRLVILDPDLSLGRTLIRVLREHGFDVVAVPDVHELGSGTRRRAHRTAAGGYRRGRRRCRRRGGPAPRRAPAPAPGLLLLSSRPPEADVYRALEAGPQDFIAKPFRVHELVARVKAQLRAQA